MSILVILDQKSGRIKKSALEVATLGRFLTEKTGSSVEGAYFSEDELSSEIFSDTGLKKITRISGLNAQKSTDYILSKALLEFLSQQNFKTVLFSSDTLGKSLAPYVAASWRAAFASGISSVEEIKGEEWVVKKNIFSGKAFARILLKGNKKVISLMPNSLEVNILKSQPEITVFTPSVSAFSNFSVKEIKSLSEGNMVPLPEAERVVSGGRGLKGPENWHLVENLARELNATTACSRPVADMHWRPHHEHVGQTGIAIRPNLYIAIGISGAIQHLAGVNGSKTIVVINNDKEAPFFKSADYGIVGDAFTVVPKFIEAVKKWKIQHS